MVITVYLKRRWWLELLRDPLHRDNISWAEAYSSSSASSSPVAALPPFDPPCLVRFFSNLFCIVSVIASRFFRSLVSSSSPFGPEAFYSVRLEVWSVGPTNRLFFLPAGRPWSGFNLILRVWAPQRCSLSFCFLSKPNKLWTTGLIFVLYFSEGEHPRFEAQLKRDWRAAGREDILLTKV